LRRRQLITLLGGTAATLPLAARAQQPTMPRVGFIWIGARGTDLSQVAGLRQGLSDRGYVLGRNLALEERYADGNPDRVPVLIAELLALRIDVLVTAGTPLTRAAQSATKTVPIVSVTGNPVGTGLVTSLSHPGGNTTGLSLLSGDYSAKWLELLKQVVPKLHRVVALSNPDNSVAAGQPMIRKPSCLISAGGCFAGRGRQGSYRGRDCSARTRRRNSLATDIAEKR
jgi:putative tryptophan/tyrosine transport system substrate-binding protein